MNDTGGNVFIDSVIPAAYSSILVLGAALYAISLATLLVPLFFVVGSIVYIVFIYRPALAAHSRRTAALRQINQEARILAKVDHRHHYASITHMRSSICSFQKTLIILKRSVQSIIFIFSDRRVRIHMAKRVAREKEWCRMNLPPQSQGTVSRTKRTIIPRSKVDLTDRTFRTSANTSMKSKSGKSKYTPPVQIARMMTAVTKGNRSYEELEIIPSKDISTNPMKIPDMPVIVMSKRSLESARAVRTLVLFDARDALSHMKCQLTPDLWDSADFFDVSESDLSAAFQNVFELFYPDGIAMSSEEISEALEIFNIWKGTQNSHFKLVSNQHVYYQVRMISFKSFEKWFVEDLMCAVHNSKSERLLSHAFKSSLSFKVEKSKQNAHGPSDIAHTLNYHMEGISNLKTLQVLTPHTLLTPPRSSAHRKPPSDSNVVVSTTSNSASSHSPKRLHKSNIIKTSDAAMI